MIRINLLPVRQARRRQFGRVQAFLGLVVIIVECAVLFVIWQGQTVERDGIQAVVQQKSQEIAVRQAANEEIMALENQVAQIQEVANILEDLEAQRSGPVGMMDELKLILNRPSNDLERQRQYQQLGWNVKWDPADLWIDSLEENNGELSLTGRARNPGDVAEFSSRLASGEHFSSIRLQSTGSVNGGWMGSIYEFEITGLVSYAIFVEQQ